MCFRTAAPEAQDGNNCSLVARGDLSLAVAQEGGSCWVPRPSTMLPSASTLDKRAGCLDDFDAILSASYFTPELIIFSLEGKYNLDSFMPLMSFPSN